MEHRLTTDKHIIDLLVSGPSTQHRLANKPTPAVNKPTASNPKAPANKPKPTVKQTAPANPQ